jgi:hypothetical protein
MRQQRVIWAAIFFSTVIYLVILLALDPEAPQTSLDIASLPQIVKILYAVALFDFIVGWILPGRLTDKPSQQRLVLAMAIFESVAIFGLLAAFMTHDWRLYLGPWALAIVGFIRSFPRAESATRPGTV